MGYPIGPHPDNAEALEEFARLCKLKETSRWNSVLYKIFGKKKTQQHQQWLATYYEWRGSKMLTDLVFNGKDADC